MNSTSYKALFVVEQAQGHFSKSIETLAIENLPQNEVLIKVAYAGLNYKDALSSSGNKGITRQYPHTPGIDAAGTVVTDNTGTYAVGSQVIVTSYDLGMNTAGGFGAYIRVPAAWVVPLPQGLSLEESMIIGTAGFTAALAIHKMQMMGQSPVMGPILVTGSTGGVGSFSVNLLHKLGYQVIASSGKAASHDFLKTLGATEIIDRAAADDQSGRPLLKPKWAGAIDTIGGNTLATAIKACGRNGSVAVCGLVVSPKLDTTVYPFILNGVNLLGVESAETPMELRAALWRKLANEWKPTCLEFIKKIVPLEGVLSEIDAMLAGKTQGRIVVKHDE